ncbi:MAG: hypothetical protein U1C58_06265 [Flavobacteriaceae bacterium]|nr:hypothetical protein [Flavobacteriaceae bacterium]MDZ4147869.1 hypothetical protein [Flavobacteriaceae bacterium]
MATIKERAASVFETTAHDKLFANKKGEFFTSENLGNLSLKPGEKLIPFVRDEFTKASKKGKTTPSEEGGSITKE